ncbi:MAG: hypothetical protein JOZ75_13705 [Candidatus Dormibacteraeota bacterium]|nr:hypothetical protein [Candidatus Dormibacteraeota bacterium]
MRMQAMPATPGAYFPVMRYPFERNLVITIAQLLAVAQGVLGLINGFNTLQQSVRATAAFGQIGVPSLGGGLVVISLVIIVLSALIIVTAIRATHPSNAARWLLISWEVIALGVIGGLLISFTFFWSAAPIALVILAATGVGLVHPYIVLTMAALIVFGLAVYPPTWDAYRR